MYTWAKKERLKFVIALQKKKKKLKLRAGRFALLLWMKWTKQKSHQYRWWGMGRFHIRRAGNMTRCARNDFAQIRFYDCSSLTDFGKRGVMFLRSHSNAHSPSFYPSACLLSFPRLHATDLREICGSGGIIHTDKNDPKLQLQCKYATCITNIFVNFI